MTLYSHRNGRKLEIHRNIKCWAEGVTAIESRKIVMITNIILDIVLLNLREYTRKSQVRMNKKYQNLVLITFGNEQPLA